MSSTESKLSSQQKETLNYLLRWTEYVEANGNDFAQTILKYWGVRWQPVKQQTDWTQAASASLSRALSRLVVRGLVERKNDQTDNEHRAVRVRLTETGREIAKRLTLPSLNNVNRFNERGTFENKHTVTL